MPAYKCDTLVCVFMHNLFAVCIWQSAYSVIHACVCTVCVRLFMWLLDYPLSISLCVTRSHLSPHQGSQLRSFIDAVLRSVNY